jgi:hypothetical protein
MIEAWRRKYGPKYVAPFEVDYVSVTVCKQQQKLCFVRQD